MTRALLPDTLLMPAVRALYAPLSRAEREQRAAERDARLRHLASARVLELMIAEGPAV